MLDEHVKLLDKKYNKIYFKKKYGTKKSIFGHFSRREGDINN